MLTLKIITPERTVSSKEIYEVTVPTTNGEITILPNHIPLINLLKAGVVSIRNNKLDGIEKMEHLAVQGGFVEMDGKTVSIMADIAITSDEVNEIEAQEARLRAQKLKDSATDKVSLAEATALLEQSIIKIKLASLKKRRHSGR